MTTVNSTWSSSWNETPSELPLFSYLPEYVFFIILSLIVIAGDLLTLLAVRMKKVRLQNDVLIQALAIYDLCNCLFVSPVAVIPFIVRPSTINSYWLLCKIAGMARVFFNIGSMAVVVLMAGERRLAITNPFYHRTRVSKRTVRTSVILASLVVAASVSLPGFLNVVHYGPIDSHGLICYIRLGKFNILAHGVNISNGLGSFIANIFVTILVAILLIMLLWMNAKVISSLHQRCQNLKDKENGLYINTLINYCPLCKLMIFVSVLASLAYAPYVAYGVISSFGIHLPQRAEIWIFNLFVWINMSLNPVAYGVARKQYRIYYLYFIKKFIRIITLQSVTGLKVVDEEHIHLSGEIGSRDSKYTSSTRTSISRISSKSQSTFRTFVRTTNHPDQPDILITAM